MAVDLQLLLDRFFEEIGDDLGELCREPEVIGWLDAGCGRLPARYPLSKDVTWTANDLKITLPDDFVRLERVYVATGLLSPYRIFGKELRFLDPVSSSGTGTVFYYGHFPGISASQVSVLPPVGDEAVVSYALHRFFRKLASSRADYRRYSTITGQSGLDVADLDALAERYRQDFVDARAELEESELAGSATFFGD